MCAGNHHVRRIGWPQRHDTAKLQSPSCVAPDSPHSARLAAQSDDPPRGTLRALERRGETSCGEASCGESRRGEASCGDARRVAASHVVRRAGARRQIRPRVESVRDASAPSGDARGRLRRCSVMGSMGGEVHVRVVWLGREPQAPTYASAQGVAMVGVPSVRDGPSRRHATRGERGRGGADWRNRHLLASAARPRRSTSR